LPDDLREAFSAVLRVPPADWDACRLEILPEPALMHRHEIQAGLRVGCAPFVADPDEMAFEVHERSDRRFYRIYPRDLPVTLARVSQVLDAMIAAKVRVGVVPELMLTGTLLAAWQDALRARRGRTGPLQWVLVGSGNIGGTARPTNVAVLLDARTGQQLSAQHKLYPFNLDAEDLERWALTSRLGAEPIDEDLEPGERLVIVEGGGVRLATLVCEDLGRVVDLAGRVRSFGVSHLLVPVFSRPTQDRRWERARADVHSDATGSTIIIANSRVMHTIIGRARGTGLVVWPEDGLVLGSARPDQLACFTLQADGGAVAD
jgi:predicted amidohydrolase